MDKQEAIERLKQNKAAAEFYAGMVQNTNAIENELKDIEAIDMAIEALQFSKHFDLLKEFQSLQEVVYCKDCDRKLGSTKCPCCTKEYHINEETFYCAWGERKEE